MKTIGLALIIAFLLTSCGSDGQPVAEELNIFNIASKDLSSLSDKDTLLGLWESDEYQYQGLTQQIRWKVELDRMILAKKCVGSDNIPFYVQIEAPIEATVSETSTGKKSSIKLNAVNNTSKVVEMTDGRACRVAIEASASDQFVIQPETKEYQLVGNKIENGQMSLFYTEENRLGSLSKINE
ncbi:MAG: hypothetical protein KDD33_04560 [Bdellovibrionales bacterium]|nr:hypothetical protein [Bdellovibrionales bacterium]